MKRMHDPKFEKEVQKKLEELSFSPSEAVWTRVQQAVNEKRRRRTPLFWFFLLPSLGLAGAGMIYFSKHKTIPPAQVVRTASVSTPATALAPVSVPASAPASMPAPASAPASVSAPPSSTPDNITATALVQIPSATGTAIQAAPGHRGHAIHRSGPEEQTSPDIKQDRTQDIASSVPAAHQDMASSEEPSYAGLPGLRSFDHQFAAPTASRLASSHSASYAKTPINIKPKYSWEMGFTGGAGLSTLNSSLFEQPAVAASNVQALMAPTVVNAAYKAPTSGVQPDISYWAGIVAQRPLSKAFTLSLGLDLHYYSTRQQIGEAVYNDPAPLYQASTYFNYQQSSTARSSIYPYYSVGNADVFVNRYYFLELPASILWKVNHSRNLPLFWENGLSLTYLVSTSSIYYNAKSGVFYKAQESMANKTQLNLSTALLVGLPVRNMRLQAGPQIQYGLTSLQHQSSIGQHLLYGGIRIVLIPGKPKK